MRHSQDHWIQLVQCRQRDNQSDEANETVSAVQPMSDESDAAQQSVQCFERPYLQREQHQTGSVIEDLLAMSVINIFIMQHHDRHR